MHRPGIFIRTSQAAIATLALASLIRPPLSEAQDLTGTWNVNARVCSASSVANYGCSVGPPGMIYVQALDAWRLLIGTTPSTPASWKCVLIPAPDRTLLGCAYCGSDDLYNALEVDDLFAKASTLIGRVIADGNKMKLTWQVVETGDLYGTPGVQPWTRWTSSKWAARKLDSVSPNITDCSTP